MFSYRWQDLITLVSKQVKNVPTQSVDALQCDLVSTQIAGRLPWKMQITSFADGMFPLLDGQQDYSPPPNIWRLVDASLRSTSTTPNDDVTLAVRDSLPVDLAARSPYAITSIALEADSGQLRLSQAPRIPAGQTWELRGSYQINPIKVSSTSQYLWFDDRYVYVAVEGLTYWYYKLADDPRAGTQLAQFTTVIKEMALAEDIGGDMQAMPDDPLGLPSRSYGWYGIYGKGN